MKWKKSFCLNLSAGENLAHAFGPRLGVSRRWRPSLKGLAHSAHPSVALTMGKGKRPDVLI